MSTTGVEYQNKMFWMEDLFIEVISHFICQSYENIGLNNFNINLLGIYETCDSNRKYPTYPVIYFSAITNPNDAQTLINVFEQAKPIILNYGNEINAEQLNALEATKNEPVFRHIWEMPIKTASLVTTLSLMQQLLNGTFPYINQSYHYQGFDGARSGEIII